jgi:hypothetical protein
MPVTWNSGTSIQCCVGEINWTQPTLHWAKCNIDLKWNTHKGMEDASHKSGESESLTAIRVSAMDDPSKHLPEWITLTWWGGLLHQ